MQVDNFGNNRREDDAKGQLILKFPFGVIKSPKKPTNFFPEFLSLKRGQIKNIRALYTTNWRILF